LNELVNEQIIEQNTISVSESVSRRETKRVKSSFAQKILRIGLVVLIMILAGFSLGFFHSSLDSKTAFSKLASSFLPDLKEHYVFLLLGTDKKIDVNRTDTIILIFLDTKNFQVDALSVLRDTHIAWSKKKNRKLNSVYAYDFFKHKDDRHAVEATRTTIEKLLAVKIDYFIKIDLNSFIEIIDLIGGVDIYVDKNMKYDDFKQDLHIRLKKGHQHLDGDKAQQFVRYRRDLDGDRSRAGRQQRFIRAVIKQIMKPSVAIQLPEIAHASLKKITTNVEFDIALSLVNKFLGSGKIKVNTNVLPGEFKRIDDLDYFEPDITKTKELIASFVAEDRFSVVKATKEIMLQQSIEVALPK
jgi:LCP family protein required for cell wall assembly